jgi:hypothetical protein
MATELDDAMLVFLLRVCACGRSELRNIKRSNFRISVASGTIDIAVGNFSWHYTHSNCLKTFTLDGHTHEVKTLVLHKTTQWHKHHYEKGKYRTQLTRSTHA